jgi:hypothetical protein
MRKQSRLKSTTSPVCCLQVASHLKSCHSLSRRRAKERRSFLSLRANILGGGLLRSCITYALQPPRPSAPPPTTAATARMTSGPCGRFCYGLATRIKGTCIHERVIRRLATGSRTSRPGSIESYKRALHFHGVDIFEIIVCQRSLTLR